MLVGNNFYTWANTSPTPHLACISVCLDQYSHLSSSLIFIFFSVSLIFSPPSFTVVFKTNMGISLNPDFSLDSPGTSKRVLK